MTDPGTVHPYFSLTTTEWTAIGLFIIAAAGALIQAGRALGKVTSLGEKIENQADRNDKQDESIHGLEDQKQDKSFCVRTQEKCHIVTSETLKEIKTDIKALEKKQSADMEKICIFIGRVDEHMETANERHRQYQKDATATG